VASRRSRRDVLCLCMSMHSSWVTRCQHRAGVNCMKRLWGLNSTESGALPFTFPPPKGSPSQSALSWHETPWRDLLRRAGVSGWPRLFHSMRASRQTELQREFPLHVVCSWLGNSPRIAQQSYLLVTEDDFAKAAGVAKVMVDRFS